MKYIFCDLGCFDGDTIEQFKNWKSIGYSPDIQWEVFGFDANNRFHEIWRKKSDTNIHFEQKAAWIKDGEIEFTMRPEDAPLGSTVMKEKRDWGQGEVFRVACFDLAKWLEQFKNDYVLMKMDIEGAELPVLTYLIEKGADKYIDRLLVEWHDGKMPSYESNKEWIQKNLKCEWHNWR